MVGGGVGLIGISQYDCGREQAVPEVGGGFGLCRFSAAFLGGRCVHVIVLVGLGVAKETVVGSLESVLENTLLVHPETAVRVQAAN